MDGPRKDPFETDGAHLASTKAPSETDGVPSGRRHPECGLHTREPSEKDGEEPHGLPAQGTV